MNLNDFKNHWGIEETAWNKNDYLNDWDFYKNNIELDNNPFPSIYAENLQPDEKFNCKESIGTKTISEVRSFALEKSIKNLGSIWNQVVIRFKDRDKLLDQLLGMQGIPTEDIEVLTLLKTGKNVNSVGLWNYMRANVYNVNFDYKIYIDNSFLDYHRNYEAAIEDEILELKKLAHDRYNYLKKSIIGKDQFHDWYMQFVKLTIKIKEEKTSEVGRFDDYFNGAQVQLALKSFKDIIFYASEIKALVFQETGDLTNTNIKGIVDNGKGLKANGPKNTNYIGIGQIGILAMREGMVWAKENKIIIKGDDPRIEPETAIILLVCILAFNYEKYLKPNYSGKNDCLNWKKIIIGSYNWSGPNMGKFINKYKSIDWVTLKSKTGMPDETKQYVDEIAQRL